MNIKNNARTTILMIGPVAPPLGGMATSVKNLIGSSLSDKYKIIVLDTTGYRTRRKSNFLFGAMYQVYLVIKLMHIIIAEHPRIVHVHMTKGFYYYRRILDIAICKISGRKIVFHLRSGTFVEFYKKNGILGKFITRLGLRLSDKVIALSEYWRNFLSGISDPDRIVVIPNGVRCSDFKLTKNKKNESNYTDRRIFVIFTGSIGKRKGVFDILEAISGVVKEIEEITFLFCGPEEYKGKPMGFQRLIKEKKLEPYVKYIEEVDGQEKIDYYMSSDIFILPSYAENFPNSLLEAMAAGLPVVVTDVGAVPEVIKDGVNGFIVKPGDVSAIAEKIIILAKDARLRKSMGERNLALAREKYDMPMVSDKIDMIYSGLL